jgi:hypothetical protein
MQYSIEVRGAVESTLMERLGPVDVRPCGGRTELVVDLVDQSHLVGLLSMVSRVGIEVISAKPLPTRDSQANDASLRSAFTMSGVGASRGSRRRA